MARAEKQSEYGPAACANSTRSVRASRHGRARVRQRTGAEGGQAPPEMRFLVGFARPRAIVLRHTVRPSPDFGLPTRFEHTGYVDKRYEGNLDEFGAAHLPEKKSRCRNHERRLEIMLWPALTRFFSQQLAEPHVEPLKWRCRCGTPTACPTGRTIASPSGAALQWRPSASGAHRC